MMDNDFLLMQDLFSIAGCKRLSKLISWLDSNRIPYCYDSKNRPIVHRSALEEALGVSRWNRDHAAPTVTLNLDEA